RDRSQRQRASRQGGCAPRTAMQDALAPPKIGRLLAPRTRIPRWRSSMSRRPLVLGLPLLAGLAVVAGCAARDEAGAERAGSALQDIKGGTADPGDQDVVDIVWQTTQSIAECSGSLLAPNMVLTAHHCVANVTNQVNGGIDCSQTQFSAPDVPSNFF